MTFAFLALILAQDATLTPGKVNPEATTEVVCRPGYTSGRDVRHVTEAMKHEVFKRYEIDWKTGHGKFEVDHLISLELGGANDITNLWPQRYCPLPHAPKCLGAREKDVVETSLHRRVCKGVLTLSEAQRRISTDWRSEYLAIAHAVTRKATK